MKITITRVGGMLPTLRPSATHDLATLPPAARQAVLAFMQSAPDPGTASAQAAHTGGMTYVFELATAAPESTMQTASASFSQVPAALHHLLPGPGPR